MTALLSVRDLHTRYAVGKNVLRAVDGVSFEVERGETVGLVGESGCGKSTLGKTVLRLVPSAEGAVVLDGSDITRLGDGAMAPHRRKVQMIFQDPFGSLNPRQTIRTVLDTALKVHRLGDKAERARQMQEIVTRVGHTWSKALHHAQAPQGKVCACAGGPWGGTRTPRANYNCPSASRAGRDPRPAIVLGTTVLLFLAGIYSIA